METLELKFLSASGEDDRVSVDRETFIIGRHSSCDLSIPDGRLSREHLKIERFDGEYFASDLGSSNGSTLNGGVFSGPVKLNDGDLIVLGGEVEITVGFEETARVQEADAAADVATDISTPAPATDSATATAAPPTATATAPAAAQSSLPGSIFIIAPLLGLIILIFAGGLIYLLSGNDKPAVAGNEFQYSTDDIEPANKKKDDPPGNDDDPLPSNSGNVNTGDPIKPVDTNMQPGSTPSGEFAKIETNGTAFLRRIATNDSHAFLTGDQAKRVSPKVKQFGGSSALAANIESARKSSSQIQSLATAKNLKPQFLAVAAITKLGSSRGDVMQTATSMADVLDKLGTHVGNELSEDALMMIAAYDQGAAGDFLKLRNKLQELANKYPESTRQIRTIWFLKEKNQITDAEFDRALTFLAIGVITQNPKEFGVNAGALTL